MIPGMISGVYMLVIYNNTLAPCQSFSKSISPMQLKIGLEGIPDKIMVIASAAKKFLMILRNPFPRPLHLFVDGDIPAGCGKKANYPSLPRNLSLQALSREWEPRRRPCESRELIKLSGFPFSWETLDSCFRRNDLKE